jgi:hypothetical protein
MEQEDAQAALAKGLQLDKGDLDKLITEFEQLVRHAGYDINQDLVLRIFTSALPNTMYEYILRTLPQPATYEQWRSAAIDQQKVYVHMRNRADRFKTKKLPPTTTWRPFGNQWRNPTRDPNAMDTSPGRTRARVAEAEDFLPGGNRYEQRVGGSREGGYPRGPVQRDGQRKVLTCFFCGKPGHFARDCRQKRNNQGPSGPPRNTQVPTLLRSVDRSVRLGRLGVCPECLMAEVGKKLDYIGVRTTERWMNTQGESACQALRGKEGRDSTKYSNQRGCGAGTLQSMHERMYRGTLQRLYKVYNEDRVIQDLKATDYWRN